MFLSHDWGTDSLGRSTHTRVVEIGRALRNRGLRVWLDEDQMTGDIDARMVEGISRSHVMAVFVTENYQYKVSKQLVWQRT